MVQNTSTITITPSLLNKILGCNISEKEFQKCQQKFQYLEPKLGKISAIKQGIYIVLNSKIRLTNKAGKLIKTVTIEEAYGHFTLFQKENFIPYQAKASQDVQLCFIPSELLFSLIAKYPQIKTHLKS